MPKQSEQGSPVPSHQVSHISREHFLRWAQWLGLPFRSERGLVMAFKRKGGVIGEKSNSPHRYLPIPVEQATQFLGGHKIRIRMQKD